MAVSIGVLDFFNGVKQAIMAVQVGCIEDPMPEVRFVTDCQVEGNRRFGADNDEVA